MKTIDVAQLAKVTGGVRPGDNGQGCTGPLCGTKPRPKPIHRPLPLPVEPAE